MKRLAIIFFILFFITSPAQASFDQAYTDYQFLYGKYRRSYQNFTVAKAAYKTYRTLTTQNEAFEKMRTTLIDRANIVSAYFILLSEKLNESEGVPTADNETFASIRAKQDNWLESHIKLIEGAASVTDLEEISADFDTRYAEIVSQTNKTVASILLSKNDHAYSKMPDLLTRTQTQVNRLPGLGEDNLTYLRGVEVAKAKVQLWESKRSEVLSLMNPKQYSYNQTTDLGKIKNLLFTGLQYLKEGTSYLNEIVTAISKTI